MEYYLLPLKEGEKAIAIEEALKKVDYNLKIIFIKQCVMDQ